MSIAIGDQVDFLFKKALGYPETNIVSALAAEKGYFSKPNIFTFQQMAQEFPQTRLSNSDFILTTSPTDITVSNVYRHKSYPYIVKYENLTLESAVSGSSNSFYSPYLKNLIPASITTDGFYSYIVKTNDLAFTITNDALYQYKQVIDPDSGVLFFFTYPSYSGASQVLTSQPPKVTFFRYEGLIGNVGIATLEEF